MVSKKYKFLLGILLLASGAFAQVGGRGSVYDSSVIPAKRMAQQNEFWNSTCIFPAIPRNMWEIGVSGGMFTVSGDVAAKLPTLGFAAHVRKAFGYVFSLRLQYLNGTGKGMNWVSSPGNSPRKPARLAKRSISRNVRRPKYAGSMTNRPLSFSSGRKLRRSSKSR